MFSQNKGTIKIGVLAQVATLAITLLPALTGVTASMAYTWTFLQMLTLVMSLNLITGFTGYINFGHIAFYGIGAYTVAYLTTLTHYNPFLFLLPAGLVTAVIALLIGRPILSVRGPYFAIATLGLGEAARTIIINVPYFNYSEGLPIAAFFAYDVYSSYFAMWIMFLIMFLITLFLKKSRFGYMLEAIRDDEDLAESMGIDTRKSKLVAYILSAASAGVIGGITAITHVYAHPGFFSIALNVSVLVSLLIGGGGTLLGPLAGSAIYFFLADTLLISFPYLHLVIFGVLIMGITLGLPRGLVNLLYRHPKIRYILTDA